MNFENAKDSFRGGSQETRQPGQPETCDDSIAEL